MNARVAGVSVDHVPCLKAWAESLGGISFPLLSDFWPHGEAARAWGVFREDAGHSERAIFIVDAEGVIRYVDVHDIADLPDNNVLFAELEKVTGVPAELEKVESGEAESDQPAGASAERPPAPPSDTVGRSSSQDEAVGVVEVSGRSVTMYCRSWCPDCARARAWLDQRGIAYNEVDVDSDAEARRRAAEHNEGRLHTPTFEIGEQVCIDFRPDRLSDLLGLP